MTAPHPHQTASCRHCGQQIETLNRPDTLWVDDGGFTNCKKDLPHEPMPAGLSGAPLPSPAPEPLGVAFTDPDLW